MHHYLESPKPTLSILCYKTQINAIKQLLSYSMVVLYIGIDKVWGFLPKNPIKKSAKYLLFDSMAALVRHSQAKKCFQINSKPLY